MSVIHKVELATDRAGVKSSGHCTICDSDGKGSKMMNLMENRGKDSTDADILLIIEIAPGNWKP